MTGNNESKVLITTMSDYGVKIGVKADTGIMLLMLRINIDGKQKWRIVYNKIFMFIFSHPGKITAQLLDYYKIISISRPILAQANMGVSFLDVGSM
jgi:hypothetical protein